MHAIEHGLESGIFFTPEVVGNCRAENLLAKIAAARSWCAYKTWRPSVPRPRSQALLLIVSLGQPLLINSSRVRSEDDEVTKTTTVAETTKNDNGQV